MNEDYDVQEVIDIGNGDVLSFYIEGHVEQEKARKAFLQYAAQNDFEQEDIELIKNQKLTYEYWNFNFFAHKELETKITRNPVDITNSIEITCLQIKHWN